MRKILIILALLGLVSFAAICFAQDSKTEAKHQGKREVSSSDVQEIEGTVSAVDNNGIAVVFKKDEAKGEEEEIYVPIEKGQIRLVHKTNIKEIEVGDTVKVGFKEVTEEEEGKESKRFKATTITFLKKAEKKPLPQMPPEPQDQVSPEDSAAPEATQTIPLKGFKED